MNSTARRRPPRVTVRACRYALAALSLVIGESATHTVNSTLAAGSVARAGLPLGAAFLAADADDDWVLWGGAPGKETAGTRLSTHRSLTECLEEEKSWEEKRRAYLRAANESRPQDQLPTPPPADSYRCLPTTAERQRGKVK